MFQKPPSGGFFMGAVQEIITTFCGVQIALLDIIYTYPEIYYWDSKTEMTIIMLEKLRGNTRCHLPVN